MIDEAIRKEMEKKKPNKQSRRGKTRQEKQKKQTIGVVQSVLQGNNDNFNKGVTTDDEDMPILEDEDQVKPHHVTTNPK